MTDYYRILNLEPSADEAEVKKAFNREMRVWSNRTNAPQMERRQEAERMIKLLEEAERVLLDATKRAEYDRSHPGSQGRSTGGSHASADRSRQREGATPPPDRAGDASSLIQEGWRLLIDDRIEEALEMATRATEMEPTNADAWALLGQAKFRSGDIDDAVYDYKRAIKLRSSEASYYGDLGSIYESIERWDEAVQQYERAAQIDPKTTMYRAAIGIVHVKTGNLDEAIGILERCVREEPGNQSYEQALGYAYVDGMLSSWWKQDDQYYCLSEEQALQARAVLEKARALRFDDAELRGQLEERGKLIESMFARQFKGSWAMVILLGLFYVVPGVLWWWVNRRPVYKINRDIHDVVEHNKADAVVGGELGAYFSALPPGFKWMAYRCPRWMVWIAILMLSPFTFLYLVYDNYGPKYLAGFACAFALMLVISRVSNSLSNQKQSRAATHQDTEPMLPLKSSPTINPSSTPILNPGSSDIGLPKEKENLDNQEQLLSDLLKELYFSRHSGDSGEAISALLEKFHFSRKAPLISPETTPEQSHAKLGNLCREIVILAPTNTEARRIVDKFGLLKAIHEDQTAGSHVDAVTWNDIASRNIDAETFGQMTSAKLRSLRNEIFARHGLIFPNRELRDYFSSQEWYRPLVTDLNENDLNLHEVVNLRLIKVEEKLRSGAEKAIRNSVDMQLVWIAPGTFTIGSPPEEAGRYDDEQQHVVTITRGYWLGTCEVTQSEYATIIGTNPSSFKNSGGHAPVEKVTWNEAMNFCKRLTNRDREAGILPRGYTYRLPTEAQWEYAARGGSNEPFPGNPAKLAWFEVNSGNKTHAVAQKSSNSWGLYDMMGNVNEWCLDFASAYQSQPVIDPEGPANGVERVVRGGSWGDTASDCRPAHRHGLNPETRFYSVGFRVALVHSSN